MARYGIKTKSPLIFCGQWKHGQHKDGCGKTSAEVDLWMCSHPHWLCRACLSKVESELA